MKLSLLKCLMAVLMFASVGLAMAEPKIGNEFDKTAQAIANDNPNVIEVTELFWYGCIHCYKMDPALEAWSKKLPADVAFKRMPALPQPAWAPMTKAYYAMEDLKVLAKLHPMLFEAVHQTKSLNPTDEVAIIDWVVKNSGLEKTKVDGAFKSFSMSNKLSRAQQYFRASGATGVPSLVIDGQFITSSTMAGGNQGALNTADYIINNIRADKAKAKK